MIATERHRAALASTVVALCLYLPTMNRTYGFIDKGEMAAAAATLGIAHPTGYPLLILLGGTATTLSPLRPILTLNLLAALLVAASVGMLTLLLDHLLSITPAQAPAPPPKQRRKSQPTPAEPPPAALSPASRAWLAAAAALFIGLTPTWWEQAVGFEAYALHAFLLPLASLLFLRFIDDAAENAPRSKLSGSLFTLALGLAFANHSTTIMLAPAFLFLYAYRVGGRPGAVRRLLLLAPAFAAGLLPYLWLHLRAKQRPPLNWGDPGTLDRFLEHVSGKQFQYVLFFEWRVFSQQTEYLWNRLLVGLAYAGAPLALFGAAYLFRRSRPLLLWTTLLFLACAVMCGLHDVNELAPYHLPAYLAAGVFIAHALAWIAERFQPRAAVALALALPLANAALHFRAADESRNTLVEDLVQNMLASLPPNAAILSSHWDYWTSGALYAQHVDGFRRDVRVLDPESFRNEWYIDQLEREAPDLMAPAREAVASFRTQIQLLERKPVLTPGEADAYWSAYHAMLKAILDGARDRRPFFVTDGVDARIGAGYARVPTGLAYRLTQSPAPSPQPFPSYRYQPWASRVDPYAVKIAEIYTMGLLARARYEDSLGHTDEARRYGVYALSFDPRIRREDVPDFPLHIETQIREVLRNYEMLRARAGAGER
jgi:hypothetical protein